MADKLTAIRLKQGDGYGPQIPIKADAENIIYKKHYNIEEILGNVDIEKGDLQKQINDVNNTIVDTTQEWLDEHYISPTVSFEVYDPTKAYQQNDYVIYKENDNQNLYICISNTPQPAGDWDSTKWQLIDLTIQIPTAVEVPIDDTLSLSDYAADAKATGDLIKINQTAANTTKLVFNTSSDVVNIPTMDDIVRRPIENGQYDDGEQGQLLRTNGDGTTEWVDEGLPTDEQVQTVVDAWMNQHSGQYVIPDESLTYEKLVKGTLGFVTPEMFGAKGDGITDDTLAIQSALDYLHTKNGGTLYFPEGIYLRNGELQSYENIRWIGSGKNSIIKTNSFRQYINLANYNTMDSLTLDGNASTLGEDPQSGGPQNNIIVTPKGNHIIIENCYFKDSVGSCIASSQGINITIKNNVLDGYKDHAIYFSTNSQNILIDGNIIHGHLDGHEAIKFRSNGKNIRNVLIQNNICDEVSAFVLITADSKNNSSGNCEDIIINGNIAYTINHAILINRAADTDTVNRNIIISSNKFENIATNSYKAISLMWDSLVGASGVKIISNNFKNYNQFSFIQGNNEYYIEDIIIASNSITMEETVTAGNPIIAFKNAKNILMFGNVFNVGFSLTYIMSVYSNVDIQVINNIFNFPKKATYLCVLHDSENVKIKFEQNIVDQLGRREINEANISGDSLFEIRNNKITKHPTNYPYFYQLSSVTDPTKYIIENNIVNGQYYMYDITGYTPSYLGQTTVLTNGKTYMATGTSGPSDWKQITFVQSQ